MGRGDGHDDALRRWLREAGGWLVVDGALGTELEAHGADLQDELWSARCLVSAPHLIRKVHLDYLEAGANIITTASYQVRACPRFLRFFPVQANALSLSLFLVHAR